VDIEISAIESRQQLRGLLLNTHVSKNKSDSENRRGSTLTKREVEVLQSIVDGKSNHQIAPQLALSPNTCLCTVPILWQLSGSIIPRNLSSTRFVRGLWALGEISPGRARRRNRSNVYTALKSNQESLRILVKSRKGAFVDALFGDSSRSTGSKFTWRLG
jgi:hypothetical protein